MCVRTELCVVDVDADDNVADVNGAVEGDLIDMSRLNVGGRRREEPMLASQRVIAVAAI